jgi:hypothetical protein
MQPIADLLIYYSEKIRNCLVYSISNKTNEAIKLMSKSSLRSSSRRTQPPGQLSADHSDSTPNVGDQHPMNQRKRAYSVKRQDDDGMSVKRQKLDQNTIDKYFQIPLRSNPQKHTTADRAAGLVGAQSKLPSAVQPPSDGTLVANTTTRAFSKDHEDRLTPLTPAPTSVDTQNGDKQEQNKRSLRSQDGGSRSKSELAQYFPNYDDIINPEPKEKGEYPLIGFNNIC